MLASFEPIVTSPLVLKVELPAQPILIPMVLKESAPVFNVMVLVASVPLSKLTTVPVSAQTPKPADPPEPTITLSAAVVLIEALALP